MSITKILRDIIGVYSRFIIPFPDESYRMELTLSRSRTGAKSLMLSIKRKNKEILVSPPYYKISNEFIMTVGNQRYELQWQHGSFFGVSPDVFTEISFGEEKNALEENLEYGNFFFALMKEGLESEESIEFDFFYSQQDKKHSKKIALHALIHDEWLILLGIDP